MLVSHSGIIVARSAEFVLSLQDVVHNDFLRTDQILILYE